MSVYVFDMDGVLFRMDEPVPGAARAVARLRESGEAIYFLTNNSSKTRADYVAKLHRLGFAADIGEVMTSSYATGRLLQEWGAVGRSVYVVGEYGITEELAAAGMNVVPYGDDVPIDYVVVGWDRGLTYQKLAEAHFAIMRGARFVATNRDSTYPDAGGRTLSGGGSIVAAIETSSGVVPLTVGKPETYTLDLILRSAGASPTECVVVGDRLDTDIAVGRRAGARTVLALTGVTSREQAEAAPAGTRPDVIVDSVADLA